MNRSCVRCEYFQAFPGSADNGECRRFPPVIDLHSMEKATTSDWTFYHDMVYPVVNEHKWCGEFKEKTDEGDGIQDS